MLLVLWVFVFASLETGCRNDVDGVYAKPRRRSLLGALKMKVLPVLHLRSIFGEESVCFFDLSPALSEGEGDVTYCLDWAGC